MSARSEMSIRWRANSSTRIPTLAIESRSFRYSTSRDGFLASTFSTSSWKMPNVLVSSLPVRVISATSPTNLVLTSNGSTVGTTWTRILCRFLSSGTWTVSAVGVEVGVRLAVDPDLADPDAAGRQDVRRDAQDVVLEAARDRAEVQVHRLLGDQQVGVDGGQVGTARTSGSRPSSGCPCRRSVPSRYGMPLARTLK